MSAYQKLNLGMIDLTSRNGNNLWDIEGQVPDDSKNTDIFMEDDEVVNIFQYFRILIMT